MAVRSGMVMGLTEDSDHNVWVVSRGPPATLIRIQDLKVREELPAPPMPIARKLALDPQSGIWLGLVSGRSSTLSVWQDGDIHLCQPPEFTSEGALCSAGRIDIRRN